MNHFFRRAALAAAFACLLAAPLRPSDATAISQTWVAHDGSDSNACTRFAPCQTFAGALLKTLPRGEINVVDAGDYGQINITQAVTIDGGSAHAVIAVNTNQPGIIIATNSGQHVTLRHLTINGDGTSNAVGIDCKSAGLLTIEDCTVADMLSAIVLFTFGGGQVVIKDTTVSNSGYGVDVEPGFGTPGAASLRNVTLQGCNAALYAHGSVTDITNSLLTQNSSAAVFAINSVVNVAGCTLSDNATALYAGAGSTVRLTLNNLWNNTVGIDPNGAGIVATAQDNRKAGNTTAGNPTPGHTIAIQ